MWLIVLQLPIKAGKKQQTKSKEQRGKSNEQRAESNKQRAKSNEQRAESNEQRAKSNEQQAMSKKFSLEKVWVKLAKLTRKNLWEFFINKAALYK